MGVDNVELLKSLLDLERRGWDSLCNGTGADFYGSLMVEDAEMVLAHGVVMDRESVVASLSVAPLWRTYEIRDARVIGVSSESAVLVYTGVASRGKGGPALISLMSSIYVRADDAWRLVLYQQTPIPSVDQ
jgi:hypothetical protein